LVDKDDFLEGLKGLSLDQQWQAVYDLFPDPDVFVPKFLKIVDKGAKIRPLEWNIPQQRLNAVLKGLEKEGKPNWLIVLKSRREGVSTWTEAKIFERVLRLRNRNGIVIAHKAKAATAIFRMARRFYDLLPYRPPLTYSNRTELVFATPHESTMEIESAEDREAGRGSEYHFVHASEVAFYPDAERTMLSVLQTVPIGEQTMVVLESTANGAAGYFYDTWIAAMNGENEFTPIFLPWHVDPDCAMDCSEGEARDLLKDLSEEEEKGLDTWDWTPQQIKWRRFTLRNKCRGDLDQFKQEYPASWEEAFLVSGRPVFDPSLVHRLLKNLDAVPACGVLITQAEAV